MHEYVAGKLDAANTASTPEAVLAATCGADKIPKTAKAFYQKYLSNKVAVGHKRRRDVSDADESPGRAIPFADVDESPGLGLPSA